MRIRAVVSDRLDAIVVPVGRPCDAGLPGLELAIELANETHSVLVLIASRGSSAAALRQFLGQRIPEHRLVCVDLSAVSKEWLPRFRSQSLRMSRLFRDSDVGEKRNLALALAAAMDWQSMLYLDDDVFAAAGNDPAEATLTPVTLMNAIQVLRRRPHLKVIGWRSRNFDDNSMAGHARSFCGWAQGVFPGSGAMLIRCSDDVPYFPAIYNEDWLFMIAAAVRSSKPRRALAVAGQVRQNVYDPFRRRRALREEAGDLVAEGLMNLFEDHGRNLLTMATKDFWNRGIMARRKMLMQLRTAVSVPMKGKTLDRRESVGASLDAALEANTMIKADEVTEFLDSWWSDQSIWTHHLAKLRAAAQLDGHPALSMKRFATGGPPLKRSRSGRTTLMRPASTGHNGIDRTYATPRDTPTGGIARR